MDALQVVDGQVLNVGKPENVCGVHPPSSPTAPPTPHHHRHGRVPGCRAFLVLTFPCQMPPVTQDAQSAASGPLCQEGS